MTLTKDFIKEIKGKVIVKQRNMYEDIIEGYEKKGVEQTLSNLSNKYISKEEHESELKKLSKWETPRIKKLKQQHEKEVKEIEEHYLQDRVGLKKVIIKKQKELKQQLSQSISIKDVEKKIEWLKERFNRKETMFDYPIIMKEIDKAFKSLSTQKEKR